MKHDMANVLAVVEVLKKRFNSLSAEELIRLAADILDALGEGTR